MHFLIINYFPEAESSLRGAKCGENTCQKMYIVYYKEDQSWEKKVSLKNGEYQKHSSTETV
jgi:hypothetical protein